MSGCVAYRDFECRNIYDNIPIQTNVSIFDLRLYKIHMGMKWNSNNLNELTNKPTDQSANCPIK